MSANGHFVWRELMTTDIEGAKAFYTGLFGWGWEGMPMGDGQTYWMCKGAGRPFGGLMGLEGSPVPCWMSYLQVADVDAGAKRAVELGGRVLHGPADIPGVGRFAVVADPGGAVFNLFRGNSDEAPPDQPELWSVCWETCSVPDVAAAQAFYTALVGWSAAPMGPDTVLVGPGEARVADLSPTPPGVPANWMPHVLVDDLDAVRARIEGLGGKILMAEIPVPGFGRMCVFQDPQGAALSMFQGTM